MRTRRWLIGLVVLAACLLVVSPLALAKGHAHPSHSEGHHAKAQTHGARGKAKGKAKFQCEATVVSADPSDVTTITVTITSGSKAIKSERGQQVTFAVAPGARLTDAISGQPLTLDELVSGARVHLGGTVAVGDAGTPAFTATKVILQALPDASPTPFPDDSPGSSSTS